ncbi:MAG: hypothetical protein ABSE59_11435, partial [Opitutaceae bacterium]
MHTDPDLPGKPRLSRLLLAGITVGLAAIGWWVFHSGKSAPQRIEQDTSAGTAAPKPQVFSPVTTNVPSFSYQTAGYSDLLDLLREKLSGSPGEVVAALAEIAKNRPELAIDLAQALARTENEKATWVQAIVKVWAGNDPQHAWNWVAEPDNQLSSAVLVGEVMNALATSDPESLIGKVDTLLRQPNTSGPLAQLSSVYLSLQALIANGNADLAQAAVESWAKDPHNLQIGSGAYEMVALALDKKSPETAATWLLSMPVSDDRNSAIGTFAYQWGQNDPVAALNWAQSLAPEAGQSEVVGRVFSEWIQSDATAATNWLDNYIANTPSSVEGDMMIGS